MNDILKEKLLAFESTLSTLDGYDGWMIGTCVICFEWLTDMNIRDCDSENNIALQIVKKGRSAVRVRMDADEEWMEVLLVKPRQDVLIYEKNEESLSSNTFIRHDKDTMSFTVSQMEEYLKKVSDTNPIHQGNGAVLPGFLVMNECLANLNENNFLKECKTLEVRFLSPLRPDEKVYLTKINEGEKCSIHLKTETGDRDYSYNPEYSN